MDNWRDRPEFDDQTATALKAAVGSDVYAGMTVQFCEDLERLWASLIEACDNADSETTRETAHALKGAALNIGLMRLGALVAAIEMGNFEDKHELDAVFSSALDHLKGAA
jgi:HPt (histidine-containing phosphotransfer) domain-containing protein